MDDQTTVRAYEAPHVIDYGSLQELTAGCLGATGGDAYTRHHGLGSGYAGVSNPTPGEECSSKP
jgi:hypothetical protein